MNIHEYDFELVNVHMTNDYAEVQIRDKNGCLVYAGNIKKVDNPKDYYPPKNNEKT